jgi:hypothetical protein
MRQHVLSRRVVHKPTGGILQSIPEPVDPVGNAAALTSNTVALPGQGEGEIRPEGAAFVAPLLVQGESLP